MRVREGTKIKEKKVEFRNSKGMKIVGILYIPEGRGPFPIAVYCHGYRSDKTTSKAVELSRILPAKGIALFRFDFSGRGESDGKFEDITVTQNIDDLRCTIDFIEGLGYKKTGIIGNSLGGLVSLQETAKDKRVKCLVLQSPISIAPWKKVDEFSDKNVAKWRKQGWTYTYSKRFGKLKINYSFYEDAQQYNDYSIYKSIRIPVLIIHGTKDELVSFYASKKLTKYIDNSEFIALKGADHDYTNKEDYNGVIFETVQFLVRHLL